MIAGGLEVWATRNMQQAVWIRTCNEAKKTAAARSWRQAPGMGRFPPCLRVELLHEEVGGSVAAEPTEERANGGGNVAAKMSTVCEKVIYPDWTEP